MTSSKPCRIGKSQRWNEACIPSGHARGQYWQPGCSPLTSAMLPFTEQHQSATTTGKENLVLTGLICSKTLRQCEGDCVWPWWEREKCWCRGSGMCCSILALRSELVQRAPSQHFLKAYGHSWVWQLQVWDQKWQSNSFHWVTADLWTAETASLFTDVTLRLPEWPISTQLRRGAGRATRQVLDDLFQKGKCFLEGSVQFKKQREWPSLFSLKPAIN